MSIWLIRAGAHGEHEQKFLEEKRVYVTWERRLPNLEKLPDREALLSAMQETYPNTKPNAIRNWVSQIWPFAHEIEKSDLVILPLKSQPSIAIGEVIGDYHYEASGPAPYFHWLPVKWLGEPVPRTQFAQDLLYSFGAFLTICRINRNDAEKRILKMRATNWGADPKLGEETSKDSTDLLAESEDLLDLEETGRDQIAAFIRTRFKKHDLTRLVDAVLRAQGYTTFVSPAGPDGGADILAGTGALGFGAPKLVVEVKSGEKAIDRSTVDKLLGAIGKFGANEGLFVSWSGYTRNVQRELATSYFKVRLWTQKELLEAIFTNYEKLDEDLRAELPLKRVWTVASKDE